MQVILDLYSVKQMALERKADAIRFAFEIASITGGFPQIERIPDYSKSPEVQAEQKAYKEKIHSLVDRAVTINKEALEAEATLLLSSGAMFSPPSGRYEEAASG